MEGENYIIGSFLWDKLLLKSVYRLQLSEFRPNYWDLWEKSSLQTLPLLPPVPWLFFGKGHGYPPACAAQKGHSPGVSHGIQIQALSFPWTGPTAADPHSLFCPAAVALQFHTWVGEISLGLSTWTTVWLAKFCLQRWGFQVFSKASKNAMSLVATELYHSSLPSQWRLPILMLIPISMDLFFQSSLSSSVQRQERQFHLAWVGPGLAVDLSPALEWVLTKLYLCIPFGNGLCRTQENTSMVAHLSGSELGATSSAGKFRQGRWFSSSGHSFSYLGLIPKAWLLTEPSLSEEPGQQNHFH